MSLIRRWVAQATSLSRWATRPAEWRWTLIWPRARSVSKRIPTTPIGTRCRASLENSLILFLFAFTPSLPAAEKITYEDNILPILRNNCLKCHNPDKLKGDLDLTTFGGALKGGGSGPAVVSGDPDGSKIIKAITHAEEPNMPPNSPKLPDKDIDLIKRWISGGLLETSGSKALAAAKPKVDVALTMVSVGKPDGPPPMPKDLLLEPVVHTTRTSVSTGLAASPWAPLIALGGQKQILLYNTDNFELLGILSYPEGYPCDLKFSRNAKLLLAGGGRGSKSGQVIVWDVTTGERIMTIGDEFDSVLAADISSDQKFVALGGPTKLVKIFSTSDGGLLHKLKKHTDWVTALEFSPDAKYLATGDRNGGLVVWDAASGDEVYTLTGHKSAITAVSWRGDSQVLASGSEDGALKTWQMSDGEPLKSTTAHEGGVLSLHYTHDARLVSCGRDNKIALWDSKGGKSRSVASTNDLPVRVTFTHDGARIIAGDFSGRVSVWNSADGKPLGDLPLNPASIAERLQATEKKVAELEQELAQSTAPKDTETQLEMTKASISKLKAGQFYTTVYQAREEFSSHQREQQKLKAEVEAAKAAHAQAAADLAAARKTSAKTPEEKAALAKRLKSLNDLLKSSAAQAATDQSSADKLTRQIATDQARVEKLSAEYDRLKSTATPTKSAKL